MHRTVDRRYAALYLLGPIVLLVSCLAVRAGTVSPAVKARAGATTAAEVDFDRDVRPILSENCFTCHGFDASKRQAGLRLDTAEDAYRKLPSGKRAIVPGKPEASELVKRVVAHGVLRMPPASANKTLSAFQVAVLRRWVRQGGQYTQHWALMAPKRPAAPTVKDAAWVRNPVDRFILARLEKEGLRPSPEADRRTLIRRVSLDLTGLPPTVAELDAFVADRRPDAYERLVDRLLASPHYGERMALPWLDLARYADTHGYHIDSHRDMWRWRDWVIDAFNRNLPYDRFTVEQLAGDLLPDATLDQKIASGFNRNHPINFEGGAIPEEYAAEYVMDRVDTTSTVFMGQTVACARCHDHKYDPVTQKEYYQLYAFFNNVPEQGLDGQKGNAAPFIKAPLPRQERQLANYDRTIANLERQVQARVEAVGGAQAEGEAKAAAALGGASSALGAGLRAHYGFDEGGAAGVSKSLSLVGKAARVDSGKSGAALQLDGDSHAEPGDQGVTDFDRGDAFSYGAWVKPAGREGMTVLSRMDDAAGIRGWDLYLSDGKAFVHLIHDWDKNAIRVNTKGPAAYEPNQWAHLFVTYDGGGKAAGLKVYVNGKPAEVEITHDTLSGTIRTARPARIGRRTPSAPFKGMIDEVRVYGRLLSGPDVERLWRAETIRPILATAADKRTEEQKAALRTFTLENTDPAYRTLSAVLADWRKKRTELDNAIPTTMVMQEMDKPRETRLLLRGQYDQKGEKVAPGVPAVLPPMPKNAPANRLGLARWLVSPSHPLTARVAVNRYWQNYFGQGIVRTSENFGTQGEWPTHPELLDWLATEFVRTGWDIKAMQRLIVTSATYRQSSRVTPGLLARDPENRLLARAPRIRLPAELVRDQALALSGLLVPRIGGPSVKPYQPAGLWEEISFKGDFTAQYFVQDHGEALYRRSLYTFWKRTVPPPSLQTFDAPDREFCMVRRSATNTPLQALVLMNDPTYVEASRKFAERLLTEAPAKATPRGRLNAAYRMTLGRSATEVEAKVLLGVYDRQLSAYRKDKTAATELLSVGESKRNETLDVAELAAWTTVTSVLFNLDEAITKG